MKYWPIFGGLKMQSTVAQLPHLLLFMGLFSCDTIKPMMVVGNSPPGVKTEAIVFNTNSIILVHSINEEGTTPYTLQPSRVPEAIIHLHGNELVGYKVNGNRVKRDAAMDVEDSVTLQLNFKSPVRPGDTLVIDVGVYLDPLPSSPITLIFK